MNFSRFPKARADIFRTSGNSVLDPPGPFLPSKLVLKALPGHKALETIKAFSLNSHINEDLKAAAERLRRTRKPVAQTLGPSSAVGRGRKRKSVEDKPKAKRDTHKFGTEPDSVVDLVEDAAHAQAIPQQAPASYEAQQRRASDERENEEEEERSKRQRRSTPGAAPRKRTAGVRAQAREVKSGTRIVRTGHHRHPKGATPSLQQAPSSAAAARASRGSTKRGSTFQGAYADSVPLDQICDALSDA